MSALQKLTSALPGLGDEEQTFECQDCGATFESDSPAERATCISCFSDEVETQ